LIVTLNRDLLPNEYRALPELNVLTGGRAADGRREYIIPDLVVTERSARYEDGDLAEAPLWGVEILSNGQTIGDLFVRAERLLKLGCPLVWVIWPEKRKAWEYSLADPREVQDELSACLPVMGGTEPRIIRIRLPEMWAELE
jgi:Uma2 family endonuclease